ncbi:unnamed protein product [Urochloa humidicola]
MWPMPIFVMSKPCVQMQLLLLGSWNWKEQEQGHCEAKEDLAEDLLEGEKRKTLCELAPMKMAKKKMPERWWDRRMW